MFVVVACGQENQPGPVAEIVNETSTLQSTAVPPTHTPTKTPTITPSPTPTTAPDSLIYKDPTAPVVARVEDLLAQMTLDEKIGQMTLIEKDSLRTNEVADRFLGAVLSGGGGAPTDDDSPEAWLKMVSEFQDEALSTRLGIPIIYGVDAVHGHNNLKGAVIFPHNIGLGAARNPELVEEIARITAVETTATGIPWNYAPVLAVPQDPRWGRYYEGYGEDPELVGELGAAYIRGLQGDDLSDPTTMVATAKHFVGDGGTTWDPSNRMTPIDRGDTQVDEETLRAIHLAPYYPALEAGAQIVMASFSSWNGEKMHGHDYLLTDVLKSEMGFDGFIVSDWQAIDQIDGTYYVAVVDAINAGVDMNMVPYSSQQFISTMKTAVTSGDISEERIDDAVRRILTVKFNLGLFEHPYPDPVQLELIGSAEHRAVAQEAASQSLVLLQNENNALPIDKDATILVSGSMADDIGGQSGGWTLEWQGFSGKRIPGSTVQEAVAELATGDVYYERFGNFAEVGLDGLADVGIVIVGEEPYAEWFGDSDDLTLKPSDQLLIRKMRDYAEKVVVVLISGRPLIITDELERADAWVAAWLPGSEGGAAIAANLLGDHPFTGKLSVTWPASIKQLPMGSDDSEPLFPYGYGLTGEETEEVPVEETTEP